MTHSTDFSSTGDEFSADYEQGWEDSIQTNLCLLPGIRAGQALEAYLQGYIDGANATAHSWEY